MGYTPLTREAIDRAEPLSFEDAPAKRITLSTTVQYRGRSITVTAEGYDLDSFSDLLDRRVGKEHAPAAADGIPVCTNRNCSRYHQPMAPSQHEGWYCKGKDDKTGNAKGYCRETS